MSKNDFDKLVASLGVQLADYTTLKDAKIAPKAMFPNLSFLGDAGVCSGFKIDASQLV